MRKTTIKKIKKIAEENLEVSLNGCDNLKSSGVDSLSLVVLLIKIEECFGIVFDDDDLNPETIKTLNDVVALTEKYL